MSTSNRQAVYQISKNDLMILLNKPNLDILWNVNRSEFGFIMYLKKRNYKNEADENQIIEIILEILSRVCFVPMSQRAKFDRFLRMLKDCQEFLFEDVLRIIHSCITKKQSVNLVQMMSNYMKILMICLKKDFFPCEKILNDIFPVLENYMNRLRERKLPNMETSENWFKELQRAVERHENPVYLTAEDEVEEMNIRNFRLLSIVPRANDIVNYEIANIPQNIIDHPYKSVDHYLSVHYRLTREDMLRAFRECIKSKITYSRQQFSESENINYFENVVIGYPPEYKNSGIYYKIKLTTSKEIDWSKKGILTPGSLVFLTHDKFNNVVFATVQSNPKVDSNKSKELRITIRLEDDSFNDELYKGFTYVLIEPTAYFECYKHVLAAIKDFSEGTFPLSDIIAYLDYNDSTPPYLHEIKQFCLHEKCDGKVDPENKCPCKIFNPLDDEEWPTSVELELDDQQYVAFKTALTKKVAVIQGPPGTGKTFIGVKVVRALLKNVPYKPIVICCLTNHALDQFLVRMLTYTKKIIRLGSQGKTEELERHTLGNMRFAIREFHQSSSDIPVKNKSLDLVKKIAPSVLIQRIEAEEDLELRGVRKLSNSINFDLRLYILCEERYLEEDALNEIIDSKYKEQFRIKSGVLGGSLSKEMLNWLVCSRSSDLYDKCTKKFYEIRKKCNSISFASVEDIWTLAEGKRYELFYSWRKKCLDILKERLEAAIEEYKVVMRRKSFVRTDPAKVELLKKADIIGVTTTGACKYKELIKHATPCITVVEEAAQVLESHVIASLYCTTQHLILIGDHEQLRPLPADNELSEKYNLKISMFERLFQNNAPSATLIKQHRMKPCIAELLVPKPYEKYESFENVYNYEEIRGFESSVFFFEHCTFEDDNSSGTSSTNEYEAKMIVALAKYIIFNQYPPQEITILTTYAAQLNLIRRYLENEKLGEIYATTVDNFQGEENEIILLSFVRSNPNIIGFLKESNRVCVALSRAKKGMFCLGNFQLFAKKNELWEGIVEKLQNKNMIGDALPLKCFHHNTAHPVKSVNDILEFLSSGCSEKCSFILPCKHTCTRNCHFQDPEHIYYRCVKPCENMIDETHKCPRLCFEKCKTAKKKILLQLPCGHTSSRIDLPCYVEGPKRLPCTHLVTVPCCIDIETFQCEANVQVTLDCGHQKLVQCHQKKGNKKINCIDFQPIIGPCGHTIQVPCGMTFDEDDLLSFCDKACDALLDCGHPCLQKCRFCFDYGIHGYCTEKCELILTCGHKCGGYCGSPCPPCSKRCFLSCGHQTYCINECLRPCVQCKESCERKCIHKRCSNLCFENCDIEPCTEPCLRMLPCEHACIGLCGDPCPNVCQVCDSDYFKKFQTKDSRFIELDCEHIIEVGKLTKHIDICLMSLEWPCCPQCSTPIKKSVRYKEKLQQAKEICIESCDTSDENAMLFYLVACMYGIRFIVPSHFRYIHEEIIRKLKRENPKADALMVLKNCVMMLKKLVNIVPKLKESDEFNQRKFDTLLLWISRHLTQASFQQLKELEEAVIELINDITSGSRLKLRNKDYFFSI